MSPNDSIGPEQLRNILGAPRKRNAEDILRQMASSRPNNPQPRAPGRPVPPRPEEQQGQDAAAQHDGALRNHLAGLVRALLQSGDVNRLRDLLTEHRSFIDGIISLLDGKNPP